MGFLDRLFGRKEPQQPRQDMPVPERRQALSEDQQAIERYRYMLRTAPPELIEQAHEEAFARLTAAQRAQVLQQLQNDLPPQERAVAGYQDDPRSLARMATRAEMRQPGTIERTLGVGMGGVGMAGAGMGMGFGGSLLTSLAGSFVGTMIAQQFFHDYGDPFSAGFGDSYGADEIQVGDSEGDFGSGGEASGDFGDDFGSDFDSDFGGDLGIDI